AAVQTAALGRVGAILLPAVYQELLVFSGLCWIAAFALFLGRYGPMLCRPRVDTQRLRPAGVREH
ncbi:MAG: NnrS family protein, partial [Candidatus Competibacterales bacterium]|nr:NnrS family protein [Candidatus Competibacterales bacterium]